jgi:hypothetical protein
VDDFKNPAFIYAKNRWSNRNNSKLKKLIYDAPMETSPA